MHALGRHRRPVDDFRGHPPSTLLGNVQAAEGGLTFLQLSDSHVGFHLAANPNALATLEDAVAKVQGLKAKPAFLIHTGDITHLSKDKEFDDAAQVIGKLGLQGHYVPGEHDVIDEGTGKAYMERYGKGSKGAGWYSFDQNGVHFVGLVNVVNLNSEPISSPGSPTTSRASRNRRRS